MTAGAGVLAGHSLLAVFAHPDDESLACGGLLAWSAALGARTTLLCVTRGEHGPAGDPREAETSGLRGVRARELEAARRVLGIDELILLDHPDGNLPWVDPEVLQNDILGALRRVQPDVVVTFGEDGLYWHPDHIAVHEAATAAVASLGQEAPALYYVTIPQGAMRAIVDVVTARPGCGDDRLILGIADPDAFGSFAAAPTLAIDVGPFAMQKLNALKCHRTQLANCALALLSDADASGLLAVEHFHRASVGSADEAFIERFATARAASSSDERRLS